MQRERLLSVRFQKSKASRLGATLEGSVKARNKSYTSPDPCESRRWPPPTPPHCVQTCVNSWLTEKNSNALKKKHWEKKERKGLPVYVKVYFIEYNVCLFRYLDIFTFYFLLFLFTFYYFTPIFCFLGKGWMLKQAYMAYKKKILFTV